MRLTKMVKEKQNGLHLALVIFVISFLSVMAIILVASFVGSNGKGIPYKVKLQQEVLPGWSVDNISGLFKELISIHNETGAWTSVTYSDIDSTMTIWVKIRGLSAYKVEKITHRLAGMNFEKLRMAYVINETW